MDGKSTYLLLCLALEIARQTQLMQLLYGWPWLLFDIDLEISTMLVQDKTDL